MAVFISYSRKDYYFAESLTFELLKRNVDAWLDVKDLRPGVDWQRDLDRSLDAASCIVLVASPEAFRSPNVTTEWQRGLKSGRRIVIALFRDVRLPPDLQSSPIVDCRGRLGLAIDRLAASIQTDPREPPPLPGIPLSASRIPRVPPWVALMALLLILPVGVYLVVIWMSTDRTTMSWILFACLFLATVALCAWFFIAAWLRRRVGMTRLAISFAAVGAVYCGQVGLLLLRGPAGFAGFDRGSAHFILAHSVLWAVLAFLPLLGLAILAFVRPEDLLRWSPTGKAWSRYRLRRAGDLPVAVPTISSILGKVQRFRLIYDVPDEPAAARFRQILFEIGAREAVDGAGATPVLLLTNRSRTLWLTRQFSQLGNDTLTVVASAIGLRNSVDWLWRKEWVDFRWWKLHPPQGFERLPAVPESIDAAHIPEPVRWMHHVLCAFGSLLCCAGTVIMPDTNTPDLSPAQTTVADAAIFPGLLFLFAAWAVIRRRMTYRTFTRWIVPAAFLGALPGLACIYIYLALLKQNPLRALVAGPLLLIAPFLLYALQPAIEFWLPAPIPRSAQLGPENLDTGGHFRTLWILLLYTLIWLILLMRFD